MFCEFGGNVIIHYCIKIIAHSQYNTCKNALCNDVMSLYTVQFYYTPQYLSYILEKKKFNYLFQ